MGRSPCCERAHTNKGAWSREEDERLVSYIRAHGEGGWRSLPNAAGLLRCGKSCRLRWMNYLRPDLKRGNFSCQEDELIIKLQRLLGNKWSVIAGKLPGRTDNEIKNYWNTHLKRRLVMKGVDPLAIRPKREEHGDEAVTKEQSGTVSSEEVGEGDNNISSGVGLRSREGDGSDHEELNLELRICPPSSRQLEPLLPLDERSSSSSRKVLCFSLQLGDEKQYRLQLQ